MRFVLLLSLLFFFTAGSAQTVAGLWRGRFTSNHPLQLTANYKYELLLFQEGTAITGFSYSTLLDGNYYAVCEVKGKLFEGYMVINEVKTIHQNPPGDNGVLQTHILFYNSDLTEATGDWKQNNKKATQLFDEEGKTFLKKEEDPSRSGLLKILEQKNAVTIASPTPAKKDSQTNQVPLPNPDSLKLVSRPLTILQTITTQSDSISLELYDDGLLDGDSVSVFANSSVLLQHIALSDKGIKQKLAIRANSELVVTLFAENQGSIPPNTGVLIIWADGKRFEIRFTSDTKQSAAIRIQRR